MLLKVFYAQTQCYSNHLIPLFLPQQCSPQYFRRRFRSESLGLYIRRWYSPAYPAYTNHPHWQNGLWKNSKTIINCINFTIFLLRFLVLWNFNKEPSATFVTWSPAERCNKNGDFVKKNRRSILFRYVTCIRYHLIKDDWTKTSV